MSHVCDEHSILSRSFATFSKKKKEEKNHRRLFCVAKIYDLLNARVHRTSFHSVYGVEMFATNTYF